MLSGEIAHIISIMIIITYFHFSDYDLTMMMLIVDFKILTAEI